MDVPGEPAAPARLQAEVHAGEHEVGDEPDERETTPAGAREGALPGAWRMGLVVTGSALCGGIAVVLWNRRLLAKMREVAPVKREDYRAQQGRLWEDDA